MTAANEGDVTESAVHSPSDAAPVVLDENFFAETAFLHTNPATGVSRNRVGTRMCTLTGDFLRGLQTAVVAHAGTAAKTVLYKAGVKWGQKYCAQLERDLGTYYDRPLRELPLPVFEANLAESFSHHGWGILELDLSRFPQGIFVATVRNPVMGTLLTGAAGPTEHLWSGIFAGIFSHLSGQELGCCQTECVAQGAPASRFLIALKARIELLQPLLDRRAAHAEVLAALEATRQLN